MGEVREEVEGRGKKQSPVFKAEDMADQINDLITKKEKDLANEGVKQEGKNLSSIAKLKAAKFHAEEAAKILQSY